MNLKDVVEQLEACHYECEAGALENNVAFIRLKEIANALSASAGAMGIELIAAERLRQIEQESWTAVHDDQHTQGELGEAAMAYIAATDLDLTVLDTHAFSLWPHWWSVAWWKPADPIRNLAKAGALIAAEIDRLTRLAEREIVQSPTAETNVEIP